MKNLGKTFEENFKKSVPDDVFCYRFRDSASSYYGGNQNLRFSASNIADYLIFDSLALRLCELKHHKGKSLPLSCIVGNKTKEKQIEDLYMANQYNGVYAHLIVFFSDVQRCFALNIDKLKEFITLSKLGERKSIPISYFEENACEIEVRQLKTNYRFAIDKWLLEQNKKEM